MADHFERLRRAFTIVQGGRLCEGAGQYGTGMVAIVWANEESARAWLRESAPALAARGRGCPAIVPAGDPLALMRRAASEGLAGIEGANKDEFPERFMFMVRVEEAGSTLPTILASFTDKGWDTCLTVTGERAVDHAEVLHWQRFDILDGVSGAMGETCPFRGWQDGAPLYELASEGALLLVGRVPLLGDWNSTDGAFAFFTTEDEARHYLEHHVPRGNHRVLVAAFGPDGGREALATLAPRAVHDLAARLHELARIDPLAAWCVNPDGHREDAGYGRLHYGGPHPVSLGDESERRPPRMAAVSGIWTVLPHNVFAREAPIDRWTGVDTIRWSGGQSLQLLPLDRSFALEPDDFAELTDSDAEELMSQQLDGASLSESWLRLSEADASDSERLGQFHIVCWDAVTGDGADYPWRFTSLLAALKHLAAYEREHDRHHRLEGAVSCNHIGAAGSGDTDFEELRSARFVHGLRRLALRIVRNGYRPSDADHLVALCNGTLTTLHVDFAGYAKDILWASGDEQRATLLQALDIDRSAWDEWESSADAQADPRGRELAVVRIGGEAWSCLEPKVRHFLATALLYLDRQGHGPQLDYAPISIEIVKALEVELGEILRAFRVSLPSASLPHDPANRTESALAAFVATGTTPTLGAIAHLLRPKALASAGELGRAWSHYLAQLPNADFLIGRDFAKLGLERVLHKYRNGGAHDSPISEATCRECVDALLGTVERPGYIPRVVAWKRSISADATAA